MRSEIPRWVISAVSLWGRQKRRVWIGTDWHGNIDGYAQSLLGRIREEGEGAAYGVRGQNWDEVFWGAGLDVQRALPGIREVPNAVLHLHYVFEPAWALKVEAKAQYIGLKKAEYWRELENGETWLHAKLDSISNCTQIEKPLRITPKYNNVRTQSTKVAKVSPPDLNLVALNRDKIILVEA